MKKMNLHQGSFFLLGLIAGGSIAGIGIAILSIKENWAQFLDLSAVFPLLAQSDITSYIAFSLMIIFIFAVAKGWLLAPTSKDAR